MAWHGIGGSSGRPTRGEGLAVRHQQAQRAASAQQLLRGLVHETSVVRPRFVAALAQRDLQSTHKATPGGRLGTSAHDAAQHRMAAREAWLSGMGCMMPGTNGALAAVAAVSSCAVLARTHCSYDIQRTQPQLMQRGVGFAAAAAAGGIGACSCYDEERAALQHRAGAQAAHRGPLHPRALQGQGQAKVRMWEGLLGSGPALT